MYEDLTPKQLAVLNFVTKFLEEQHYPPSIREICAAVGLRSTSSVHAHIKSLENKGYLNKSGQKKRAISPANVTGHIRIPLVGNVAAGTPILAQENIEDYFPLPASFPHSSDLFMLKVKGDSMINIGILDGDYIIVDKQPDAENGDLVVAMVDDEATVKNYYKEDGHIRLQPQNDSYAPIIVKDVVILGKVKGLFRSL